MAKSIAVAVVVGVAMLIGHGECFRSAGKLGLSAVGKGRLLCPQLRRSVGVFQNLKSQARAGFLPFMDQVYRIDSDLSMI